MGLNYGEIDTDLGADMALCRFQGEFRHNLDCGKSCKLNREPVIVESASIACLVDLLAAVADCKRDIVPETSRLVS